MMLPMARRGIGRFLGRQRPISSNSSGRMETTAQEDPSTARWAMLYGRGRARDEVGAYGRSRTRNAAADPRTSNGRRHLRISFDLAAPPASSFLRFDWEPGDDRGYHEFITVVATHDDSALILMDIKPYFGGRRVVFGYFVYRVGAARPPALTLLPGHGKFDGWLYREGATGLLRRGDGDLLVVSLDLSYETTGPRRTAELLVLRVGASEWERKRPVPILLDKGTKPQYLQRWCAPDTVVPVGDRFLCWVNYRYGFLLCDMAEASTKLRYVPLPAPEGSCTCVDRDTYHSRNMCDAGAGAVRLVTLDILHASPRPPLGRRERRTSPFTVTMWTLSRLSTDTAEPMSWAKDSVLHCEELRALPGYEGIPCLLPRWPVVSPNNPDVVCFMVYDKDGPKDEYDRQPAWMVEVDMRRKMLRNVVQSTVYDPRRHFPVKLYS